MNKSEALTLVIDKALDGERADTYDGNERQEREEKRKRKEEKQ